MEVGMMCQRPVFTIRRSDEVGRAAQLMREKHIGHLIVVELEPLARPVGVLTDHDIVAGVVARALDPDTVRVGEIMTDKPIMARESDSVEAALQKMLDFGLSVLPVVNDRCELVGILAQGDLLKVILGQAQRVVDLTRNEREKEAFERAQRHVAIREAAAAGGANGAHRSDRS
jgi:CBS domain-containing protein